MPGTRSAAKDGGMPEVLRSWGRAASAALSLPGRARSKAASHGMALFERASVSPRMARPPNDAVQRLDVSAAAASVSVPTLVMHRREDWIPIGAGRYLADIIPGARFGALEGTDHAYCTQASHGTR